MARHYKRILILIGSFFYMLTFPCIAQNTSESNVSVDEQGIMRWSDGTEVYGFGVNYTVPFAHAYRSAKRLGIDPKQAIRDDVYHFARLGFDAYRVHVWDTEISDTLGNLLVNEHLELFDYMLNEMKKRGMKFILTPIAFWGNGWPDRDEKTPGFSHKYGKSACLTNEDAIKAQENYLFQFLNHVNPYTGLAYKDDPDIVAFEISNEPHHREAPEQVTAYIYRLAQSMRKTGCGKPIFYNVSHSIHLANAYFNSGIQGGTFQWYPTGLGFQKELKGNMLPNVDNYQIPFDDVIKQNGGAKIVYEFDAADVGRSYIYPAIARSFRTAGIQWATHFSYDPTFLAFANTEYNTHYMNLVYAPQKTISLKIAGEVFHQIPMGKDFGTYPENTTFDAFHVSYEHDIAEMVTDEKFFYSNHTKSIPKSIKTLKEIAGSGNSPIVHYEGLGAYFLDQLEEGVWRLEVMPDALWIDNLFGRNSLEKTRAVINWHEWPMTVELPDLGNDFNIQPINKGNTFQPTVQNKRFAIYPGTYLLTRDGKETKIRGDQKWKNIRLDEFVAPESTLKNLVVLHTPIKEITAGQAYKISATIASPDPLKSVNIRILSGFRGNNHPMKKEVAYQYSCTIPADEISTGYLRYQILIETEKETFAFPGKSVINNQGHFPSDSDPYEVKVLSGNDPIYLFDALSDNEYVNIPWSRGLQLKPLAEPSSAVFEINPEKLFTDDPENPEQERIYDCSMRYFFGEKIQGRKQELKNKKTLHFSGNSLNGRRCPVQIGLVTKNGDVFGAIVELNTTFTTKTISLSDLRPVKLVTLPRPYPSFLPYYFDGGAKEAFNINEAESLQISIGPGISEDKLEEKHGIAVGRVWLE